MIRAACILTLTVTIGLLGIAWASEQVLLNLPAQVEGLRSIMEAR